MRLLAIDFSIWQQLKPKYAIALSALPIGLMFGTFVPLWFIASALAALFGIPENAPVKEQENGWLWLAIVLAIMVILMIAGYLLGYVLNAVIMRFAFRWPVHRLRALFLHSAAPTNWLKESVKLDKSARASAAAGAAWANVRAKGRAHFIFHRGVLSWGVPMYLLLACGPALFGVPYRAEPSLLYWVWQAALWGMAGALFGWVVWTGSEKQYRKQNEDKKP